MGRQVINSHRRCGTQYVIANYEEGDEGKGPCAVSQLLVCQLFNWENGDICDKDSSKQERLIEGIREYVESQ